MSDKPLLEIKELKKYFVVNDSMFENRRSYLKAVDGISFEIKKGETFGLVGESGCGKSTTGRSIVRLYEPTGGKVIFDGDDITNLSDKEMLKYRKRIQMIFQDPYASLNTRMTVADIIGEGLDIHTDYKGEVRQERIFELLARVGLKKEHASRYPHEFPVDSVRESVLRDPWRSNLT